jgi:hypothetical protein
MTERFAALEGEVTARLASIESEYRGLMKKLFVRTGASIVAARSAGKRADDLSGKISTLEATMARLLETLLERKLIE